MLNILNKMPKAAPVVALMQLIKAAQKEAGADDLHLKELSLKFSTAHIITVNSMYAVVMSICIPRHVAKSLADYEKMFCTLVRTFAFNIAAQNAKVIDMTIFSMAQCEPFTEAELAAIPKEIVAACHSEIEKWKKEYRR